MPRHERHHQHPVHPQHPGQHEHPAHGGPQHPDPHAGPQHPQSSWEIPPLSFAALRDFFDTDEETAAAQVAFARGPEELRVAANVAAHLPKSTREERLARSASTPSAETGAFFGDPVNSPFNGVPLPAVDEVAEITGDAALAHRSAASMTRQGPEEIRALIVMLVRAGLHAHNSAVEDEEATS